MTITAKRVIKRPTKVVTLRATKTDRSWLMDRPGARRENRHNSTCNIPSSHPSVSLAAGSALEHDTQAFPSPQPVSRPGAARCVARRPGRASFYHAIASSSERPSCVRHARTQRAADSPAGARRPHASAIAP